MFDEHGAKTIVNNKCFFKALEGLFTRIEWLSNRDGKKLLRRIFAKNIYIQIAFYSEVAVSVCSLLFYSYNL